MKAAYKIKYEWLPAWQTAEDVIIAKSEADAREKLRERLLHKHIDGMEVTEVKATSTVKVVDVTI